MPLAPESAPVEPSEFVTVSEEEVPKELSPALSDASP